MCTHTYTYCHIPVQTCNHTRINMCIYVHFMHKCIHNHVTCMPTCPRLHVHGHTWTLTHTHTAMAPTHSMYCPRGHNRPYWSSLRWGISLRINGQCSFSTHKHTPARTHRSSATSVPGEGQSSFFSWHLFLLFFNHRQLKAARSEILLSTWLHSNLIFYGISLPFYQSSLSSISQINPF